MASAQIQADLEWLKHRYKGDAHGYTEAALARIEKALGDWEAEALRLASLLAHRPATAQPKRDDTQA